MLRPSFQPMPSYFLVRIPLKDQQERLEKVGNIYLHPKYIYMTRGMQCGEVVAIGEDAGNYFPEAKIGDLLLFNHLIEGKRDDKRQRFYFIHEDDKFSYYAVTGFAGNGERNMSYAIWDGSKIVPNKDYIFLETETKNTQSEQFEFNIRGNRYKPDIGFSVSKSGILIADERKKTREEVREIMKVNMDRMRHLSMFMSNPIAIQEIESLQIENAKYSTEINTRRYEPHIVHAINDEYNDGVLESFGEKVNPGETVLILNIACDYKIEFNKKEYIVSETQYCAGPLSWYRKAVTDFKSTVIVP